MMEEQSNRNIEEVLEEDAVTSALERSRLPVGIFLCILIIAAGGALMYAYTAQSDANERMQTASVHAVDPFADVALKAKSAMVVDIQSGKTLYALNPDAQLPLASLTKVALVLTISEVLSPDQIIIIPKDTAPPGSLERLAKGQTWRVKDIINFTLVASSNGGAEILAAAANDALHARYPQSSLNKATLWRMNDLVKSLGLQHTYYLNVSGLDESTTLSGGYGTAADMAKLFAYAASAGSELFSGTTRDGLLLTSVNGKSTSAINTNDAQGSIPGLIMGKTGLTDLAGGNLAVVFDVGPAHPVVAVVLGSTREARFTDMEQLVERTRAAIAAQ